jgi:nicotinate-nucleotide--dimethylbenzimidazole phosphoribosyltransferase
MDLALELAHITGNSRPTFEKKCSYVMAADHGIVEEGVSAYPPSVTLAILKTILKGGAGINTLARSAGADVFVADVGIHASLDEKWLRPSMLKDRKIAFGTKNMLKENAMSEEQAQTSILQGYALALECCEQYDIVGLGELGIGNTTAATAIACAALGLDPMAVTGRGTGLDDEGLHHKAKVICEVLNKRQPMAQDGLDILMKVGGLEIGAMAGFILGCAKTKTPLLLDGLISTSAAVIADLICPLTRYYVIATHEGQEPAHHAMLEHLGKSPLFNLSLRLGEGTGAALAMPMVDSAQGLLCDMMTLDEALSL